MNIFLCTCSLRMDSHLPTNKFSTCTTKIGLSSLQPGRLHNLLNKSFYVSKNCTEAAFVVKVMFP